jgi:hypothetical protein
MAEAHPLRTIPPEHPAGGYGIGAARLTSERFDRQRNLRSRNAGVMTICYQNCAGMPALAPRHHTERAGSGNLPDRTRHRYLPVRAMGLVQCGARLSENNTRVTAGAGASEKPANSSISACNRSALITAKTIANRKPQT